MIARLSQLLQTHGRASLTELAQAMRDVEADFGACERDALYRETLKRFGLTVLTPKARTHLDAAFARK